MLYIVFGCYSSFYVVLMLKNCSVGLATMVWLGATLFWGGNAAIYQHLK